MTYEQISKVFANKANELRDEETGKVNYARLAGALEALLITATLAPITFKEVVENAS